MKVVSHSFRPLSGSYISQYIRMMQCFCVTLFPSPIGELHFSIGMSNLFNVPVKVSVPYRGATFLNSLWFSHYIVDHCFRPLSGSYISQWSFWNERLRCCLFPSPIGELHFSIRYTVLLVSLSQSFRPLSGSYISQYHLRNPMSCLGRIGGLRGKSNSIEMQPFWKVKNSHKSNI